MTAVQALPENIRNRAFGIIPARYASTRFPGKPLTPLKGRPMFWHVWHRACQCPELESVTLATDDKRIFCAAEELGVPVVMTGTHHQSGTDRVHEAARLLNIPENAVVVNIQGDEPALDPGAISLLLSAFVDPGVKAATLAHPIKPHEAPAELARPDKVKVVLAVNGDALYFSRTGIPFARDGGAAAPVLGHIGLYAFTMATLELFVSLPQSPLELTEKLEQLRLLENGIPLRVVLTGEASPGVDHAKDVERVLSLL